MNNRDRERDEERKELKFCVKCSLPFMENQLSHDCMEALLNETKLIESRKNYYNTLKDKANSLREELKQKLDTLGARKN
jgi:hypothetical protein